MRRRCVRKAAAEKYLVNLPTCSFGYGQMTVPFGARVTLELHFPSKRFFFPFSLNQKFELLTKDSILPLVTVLRVDIIHSHPLALFCRILHALPYTSLTVPLIFSNSNFSFNFVFLYSFNFF